MLMGSTLQLKGRDNQNKFKKQVLLETHPLKYKY